MNDQGRRKKMQANKIKPVQNMKVEFERPEDMQRFLNYAEGKAKLQEENLDKINNSYRFHKRAKERK